MDDLDTLYDKVYFDGYTGSLPYQRGQPEWIHLFGQLAQRIVEQLQPTRVLDVGCAMGFLVETLRDRNVAAFGVDGSSYALSQVREDLREVCWREDVAELDTGQTYDLVTCIEVLEHLEPPRALLALDRLTQVAPTVLFSSSPTDHDEPTHCNVQPIGYWVEAFAARGFRPVLDADFSSFAPQAMLFERGATWAPEASALYVGSIERAVALHSRTQALRVAETELLQARRDLATAQDVNEQLAEELHALRSSDGARVGAALRRSKQRLLPSGSTRHRVFVDARERLRYLTHAPPILAPRASPPPPPAPPRPAFAERYLHGSGLEIGALHFPMPVPPGVKVTYVDRLTREELVARYPELDPTAIVTPTVIENGFSLGSVAPASQDFVIANHVLEHTPHTVQTLCAWSSVLRPDGMLLLSVPIGRLCFDRRRPLTPVQHFLTDHQLVLAGAHDELQVRDLEHYEAWVSRSLPEIDAERGLAHAVLSEGELQQTALELQVEGEEIHFHTFSEASFRRLLECVSAAVDPSLSLIAVETSGSEVLAALRKLYVEP